VVVGWLEATEVTPNQVTFASIAVFVVAAALLAAVPTWGGLVAAALLMQASYVLDCTDGQLARYKGLASPVGALLDFLMDEVKAFLLVGAGAVRQWRVHEHDARWLLGGIGGLIVVASGIALTSFMRRGEYLAATGRHAGAEDPTTRVEAARSPLQRVVGLVERGGKFVFHYPSYLVFVALFDEMDAFLVVYLATHVLYLGRSGLTILLKLGRPIAPSADRTERTAIGAEEASE
jgi:phosphatidylglycerophosphate synthase